MAIKKLPIVGEFLPEPVENSAGKAIVVNADEASFTIGSIPLYSETDPLAWLKDTAQTELTGDKSGSFNIITTNFGKFSHINITDETTGYQIDDIRILSRFTNEAGNNYFIGESGNFTMTGQGNIGIGESALISVTDGVRNLAIGKYALYANTTGSDNLAIGVNTLVSNTEGIANVGIGWSALLSNISGSYNVSIGEDSLRSNITGDKNVSIGYRSGYGATGSHNIFLGAYAGYYETGDNKLFIDNYDRTDEATSRTSSLIYGVFSDVVANQSIVFNVGSASFGSGTLEAGAITGTSFIIGADTLSSFTNLKSVEALSFVSTSFVKMTAAGTFALDTNIYLTSVTAHSLLSATHSDTTASTVTRGAIIVGTGATPKWDGLTLGIAGKILRSDGTDLKYTTATFADTYEASTILYANGANTIQGLATMNSGVLVTNDSGVPSIATNIPTAVTIGSAYIYRAGGTDVAVADGGTGRSSHTAYALIAGGTTTTAAQQSVANSATTGAVLVSAGTSAVPTYNTSITLNANSLVVGSGKGMPGFITFSPQTAKLEHFGSPAQIDGSQKRWYLLFDPSSDESADFQFVMPFTYNANQTLTCILLWTSTVASNNVVWNASLMATTAADAADLETDSFDTVNAATTAANATIGRVSTTSITMTNKDSVAAGDICTLRITRDADNASDTNTGDAELAGIILEWN